MYAKNQPPPHVSIAVVVQSHMAWSNGGELRAVGYLYM